MSGIVVLLGRDGAPVDASVAARLLQRLSHRAIDGERVLDLGWAVLGHAHFWTTPEEVGERQPLTGFGGRLHLVFDGRLDNRDEIVEALGRGGDRAVVSDAALVLAALERWGNEALARLLGPFSLVLLDERRRSALLARDALGDRGLYYSCGARFLVVASEESAVTAHPGVSSSLDDGRLALHFALRPPVDDSTFFRSVKLVPPGHFVLVGPEAVGSGEFRRIVPDPSVRSGEPMELAQRLQESMARAVGCRLRAVGRAAVLLSGGLDSAPVAAIAAREARARGGPDPLTVSWVFDSFPESDERLFSGAVASSLGLENERVPCDDALPLSDLDRWPINPNTASETMYRWLSERAYQRARQRGCRALLTGLTGDDLYQGAEDWLWSLITSGRLTQGVREAREFAREKGMLALLRSALAGPIVKRVIRRRSRRPEPPVWLTPEARCSCDAAAWLPPGPDVSPRPAQHRSVVGLDNAEAIAGETYHAHRCAVDLRHPYRDVRVVELMLGLPSFLLRSGRWTRPIMRMVMSDLLPPAVIRRRDKASFLPLYRAALRSSVEGDLIRQALADPHAPWRSYVRHDWVARAAPGERSSEVEELVLWQCAWLALWEAKAL